MKIVVLDGYAMNPGDLKWDLLSELGELVVHDRTPSELLQVRSKDADILLTNKTIISREIIFQNSNLKYIGELATGFDNIDIKAAAERGIPVCNVPGYSTDSVAQHTFALIMELSLQIAKRSEDARNGGWVNSKDFCYGQSGLIELKDKTLGLIGLGKIGASVAKIGDAFGMKILANVRHPENYNISYVDFTSMEDIFSASDIISLHCPMTNETQGMVNMELLHKMKKYGFLINTARGGLIDEDALANALNNGLIAGAGLDVLSSEPPLESNPLLTARNCLITPHIAWATKESRIRLMAIAATNIKSFFAGKPQNVVNGIQ